MVASMPVCSASRASLLTGKYTTSTGMVINELRMNTRHRCLAHCLNDAGFETCHIGKWHLYANELGNHLDPKNSFVPPGPDRLGFDGYWAAYNFHHEYFGEQAYYHTISRDKNFFPDGTYEPDGQTDLALSWLSSRKKKQSPFYLQLCWGPPHDPWGKKNVPTRWLEKFKDTQFPIPPNYSRTQDLHGDDWSNIKHDPETINRWKQIYYAMTSAIDDNLGRLRRGLVELDLDDNTIIIFTSDHGEMFGAHGRMKKNIFYDEAALVPFLLYVPQELRRPGGCYVRPIDVCASYVDIMPTLLGIAQAKIPPDVEGVDVSHLIHGDKGEEPEFSFLQNTGACASWENGHEWRAVRDRRYTYAIFKADGVELLFDNRADPFQMHNLSGDSAHRNILEQKRNQLKLKMASLNDTFEDSLYYRENWISTDRKILRSATIS